MSCARAGRVDVARPGADQLDRLRLERQGPVVPERGQGREHPRVEEAGRLDVRLVRLTDRRQQHGRHLVPGIR